VTRNAARDSSLNKLVKPFSILIFLLLFCAPLKFQVSADTTIISLQPQASRVWGDGETFKVDVFITGVADLYGWQVWLYYDSTLLNGTSIVEGPFLKTGGGTYFFDITLDDNYNGTHGRATAACTLLGKIPGVTGSGILATITFTTKTIGSCLLTFSDTRLGNSRDIEPISHTAANGGVEVVPAIHDVAVKNVALSRREIAEGRTVDVYVSVANEGNRSEDFNVNLYANDSIVTTENVVNLTAGTTRNLILAWNTTGAVTNSSYQIKAEAKAVPEETDLSDNVFVDGFLLVTQRNHDVAVSRVTPLQTTVYVGQKVNVTAVVVNNGAYYETFDVALCYDNATVGIKNVANFPYGEERSLNFVWDTTGVGSNKSYIMKAIASKVPGETDTLNNTFTDGNITVLPREALSINITEIVPCNQLGQPVSSFAEGTMAGLKIRVSSNSMNSEPLLLTVNLYDAGANAIGVISFKGPTAPGETTFILGSPIPYGVRLGTAKVYANALTNWPHLGGVPYSPERTATFQITGR